MAVHLPNAPIVEALIDIRVAFGAPIDMDAIRGFVGACAPAYPVHQTVSRLASTIQLNQANAKTAIARTEFGVRCTSRDGRQVVQARFDGFTFSRLQPYQTWSDLQGEARRLWTTYCEKVAPKQVMRLAVRYINKIEPGLPSSAILDVLETRPVIPARVASAPEVFFAKMEIPCPSAGIRCMLTESLEPSAAPPNARLIFDIDVFEEKVYPPTGDEIWTRLEDLRHVKNEVFFGSFHERAMEWFQ